VGRVCGTHGTGEKSVEILVGKPEGKRPFVRRGRRWEDGIRMDVKDIGWGEWIQLAHDRGR
jgi:hypothetical protein